MPLNRLTLPARAALLAMTRALLVPLAAQAQNIAVVNGKPVPKSRVEAILAQSRQQAPDQPVPPELEAQAREQAVLREIFTQEAERRGVGRTEDYKQQMALMRQSILIRAMFEDYRKNNPVTDAEAQAEYDKFKAQAAGTEYRASHILVESEDEAKAIIADVKGGAKFEDLAKAKSKDPGSGANGGDLDFAKPENFVPEFSQAMTALKKGQMTEQPVKSQFGWHIIRLDDTRDAEFPPFDSVKAQIVKALGDRKLQDFQQQLRDGARTDYKFSGQ
jgi:peptidyl-prolyl cis-trans isomerase C